MDQLYNFTDLLKGVLSGLVKIRRKKDVKNKVIWKKKQKWKILKQNFYLCVNLEFTTL